MQPPPQALAFAVLQQSSWSQIEALIEGAFSFRADPLHDAHALSSFAEKLIAKLEGTLGSNEDDLPTALEVGLLDEALFASLVKLLPDEKDKTENASKRFLLAAAHQYCQEDLSTRERTTWRTRDINPLLSDVDMGISNVTLAIQPLLSAKPRLIRPTTERDPVKTSAKQQYYQIVRAGLLQAKDIIGELAEQLKASSAIARNPTSERLK